MTTIIKSALASAIALLRTEHATFVAHELISHRMLYKILAGAMELTEKFSREEIKTAAEAANIKVTEATTDFLVAVKLVILPGKDDRLAQQKCSAYAKAIEIAFDAGQTSGGIAAWLEANGGVEAVRMKDSEDKRAAAKKRIEDRQKAIAGAAPITVNSALPADTGLGDVVSELAVPHDKPDYKALAIADLTKGANGHMFSLDIVPTELPFGSLQVWLVTRSVNGTCTLVMATTDDAVVNSALVKFGSRLEPENPDHSTKMLGKRIDAEQESLEQIIAQAAENTEK